MIKKKITTPESLPCVIEVVEIIKTYYSPDKIILFGPYVMGNITKKSEINLFVIKDSYLPKGQRAAEIQEFLSICTTPVDLLMYTPLEFEKGLMNRGSFIYNVMNISRVLYDKELELENAL